MRKNDKLKVTRGKFVRGHRIVGELPSLTDTIPMKNREHDPENPRAWTFQGFAEAWRPEIHPHETFSQPVQVNRWLFEGREVSQLLLLAGSFLDSPVEWRIANDRSLVSRLPVREVGRRSRRRGDARRVGKVRSVKSWRENRGRV